MLSNSDFSKKQLHICSMLVEYDSKIKNYDKN